MPQRRKRQPVACGRVARREEELAASRLPLLGDPLAGRQRVPALHRHDVARRGIEAALEHLGHAGPGFRIGQFGIRRIDVVGKLGFLHQPLGRVLVRGIDGVAAEPEILGDGAQQRLGVLGFGRRLLMLAGDQRRIGPHRFAVLPPVERKGPARQGFAWIPLALAVVQEASRREAVAQAADQLVGQRPLGRADGVGVPLARLEIVDRHEGRLAAHGEADVVRREFGVHLAAERIEAVPACVGERLGDARMLGDTRHLHVEVELDIGEACIAGDGRGIAIMRRRSQRHMALAGQQARSRIEADPAGARQIDLAPGVQVGEVVVGAGGAIERDEVGLELDQIAGDEARGEAEIPQRLHQQPARIAARALLVRQRFLGRPDAGLEPHDVADRLLHPRVQRDEKVDGDLRRAVDPAHEIGEQRPGRLRLHVDRQIVAQIFGVGEGRGHCRFLDEEVERVVDRHVGDEVDFDLQLGHRLGEDEAGEVVAVGVLLQVDEVLGRRHPQRVAQDLGLGMRRRLQANNLGLEDDRAVIFIVREVVDGRLDRHARCSSEDASYPCHDDFPGGA